MLRFITKKEYWKAEDDGTTALLPAAPFAWHLKNIQDAIALTWLKEHKGKDVAEIGGGDSRVLRVLAAQNRATNIDSFEGLGNGPTTTPGGAPYTIKPCLIGTFDQRLKPDSFHILFSISVVEHIVDDKLADFHEDCLRILKPGGLLLHFIDLYLRDTHVQNKNAAERLRHYISWFDHKRCTALRLQQVIAPAELRFSCAYASNPDNVLNCWNKTAPSLSSLRAEAQSVSLIFAGKKTAAPA
jgi:hypothetical protein